jgi:hypothetical protein
MPKSDLDAENIRRKLNFRDEAFGMINFVEGIGNGCRI